MIKKIIVILIIGGVFFSLVLTDQSLAFQRVQRDREEARIPSLLETLKKVWQKEVWPFGVKIGREIQGFWLNWFWPKIKEGWVKLLNFLNQEIEERRPIIKEELQKEKEEIKEELPKIKEKGASLWQGFKELFK